MVLMILEKKYRHVLNAQLILLKVSEMMYFKLQHGNMLYLHPHLI